MAARFPDSIEVRPKGSLRDIAVTSPRRGSSDTVAEHEPWLRPPISTLLLFAAR